MTVLSQRTLIATALLLCTGLCAGCVTTGTADRMQAEYDSLRSALDGIMDRYGNMTPEERELADARIQRLIDAIQALEQQGDAPRPKLAPAPILPAP